MVAATQALIGDSEPIKRLRKQVPTVARARRTTLITGATGTGKEVLAAHLHAHSAAPDAPFVPVHCGALPDHLVESELFGHTRGAFTGALEDRRGLVRAAARGTLLLDEVDALSAAAQAKLLRFLESGELRPVGSDRAERVPVWVIAATNRDLEVEVAEGRFREDLLYRLNVLHLSLPPLRRRGDDLLVLGKHFLSRLGGPEHDFSSDCIQAMRKHEWPGNVRELKHRIERAILLDDDPVVDADRMELTPLDDGEIEEPNGHDALSNLWRLIDDDGLCLSEAIDRCERALIEAALQAEQNNRTRAARRLGIHVRTIFKKLSR